ncbi:MAG: hypothetical protein HYW77_03490 [Parcubacteria group bacterium]|nr:hypothetical protein [Parcubacteria group bacterium]
MLRIMGIGKSDTRALYDYLCGIGEEDLFGSPVYVMTNPRFKKHIESNGFRVILSSNINSQDDAIVKEQIVGLKPATVSKIILVSADFQDYASSLEAASDRGIKIVIVATKTLFMDRGVQQSMLPGDFDSRLAALEGEFFDLADQKEQLMLEPWDDRKSHSNRSNNDSHNYNNNLLIKASLEFPFSRDLMLQLTGLMEKFNGSGKIVFDRSET